MHLKKQINIEIYIHLNEKLFVYTFMKRRIKTNKLKNYAHKAEQNRESLQKS